MNYINYLKENQPVVFKTFKNSLEAGKLFHAYLLSGQTGTPLLEIANFIARSILCDYPNPFACEECSTCRRMKNGNYSDFIIVDGKQNKIRKEDISNIEIQFSKSSQEKKNIKIYIINLIENMNQDCVSVLLKFLEEPGENTYAILTTENEFKVLPTILSRVEIIHFNLIDKMQLINESIALGVGKSDAEILSNFYNDSSTILEKCDDNFKKYKEMCIKLLKNLNNKYEIRLILENEILSVFNNELSARWLFDLIIFFFKESLSYKTNKTSVLESYLDLLDSISKNIKKLDSAILKIMNARYELTYNVNIGLTILHAFTEIYED